MSALTTENIQLELQRFAENTVERQLSNLSAVIRENLRHDLQEIINSQIWTTPLSGQDPDCLPGQLSDGESAQNAKPSRHVTRPASLPRQAASKGKLETLDTPVSLRQTAKGDSAREVHDCGDARESAQRVSSAKATLRRKLTMIQAIVPTPGDMPDELSHYFRMAKKKTHALTKTFENSSAVEEESTAPKVKIRAQEFYLPRPDSDGSGLTPKSESFQDRVKHTFIGRCVSSPVFEYGVLFIILLNALFLVVETQVEVSHDFQEPQHRPAFRVIHLFFFVIFAVELGLRIYAYRWTFFQASLPDGQKNTNRIWNIVDCFIVAGAAVDVLFSYTGVTTGKGRLNSISVLRLLRTLRIGNFFRMRKLLPMFTFLRIIVLSIYHSWSLFLWCAISLNVITFVFSIYFTDMAALEFQKGNESRELEQYFGSVWSSQLTLLKAVTGGKDWGDLEKPLTDVDVGFAFLPFLAYLMFSVIVTMNVFTGIFLDSASQRARYEKEAQLVRAAHEIFKASDFDNTDTISKSDFRESIHKTDVSKFFSAIDLDVLQAEAVFDLLDSSNDGFVSYDEFLRGCMRLCGGAKALDLLILSREVTQLFDWLGEVIEASLQGANQNKEILQSLQKQVTEIHLQEPMSRMMTER